MADPTQRILVGAIDREALELWEGQLVLAVDPTGRRLTVADDLGTRIVDVSDPSQPTRRGLIPVAAIDICMEGDLVFIADGWASDREDRGLTIVDAVSADQPVIRSRVRLDPEPKSGDRPMVRTITVHEARAYMLARGTWGSSKGLFVVVDVSNPDSPALLSRIALGEELNLEYAGQIAIRDGHAFIAAGYSGMLVMDVADPLRTELVATLPGTAASVQPSGHGSRGSFSHIALRENYAYLFDSHEGRLVVADISDPTQPRVVGRNTRFAGEGNSGSMAVDEDYLYVAFEDAYREPDLVTFHHYHPAPDRPVITTLSPEPAGYVRLSVFAVPGVNVLLQRSDDLQRWQDWTDVRMGTEPVELVDMENSPDARRFYRAVVR
jgi:hypothetical protein